MRGERAASRRGPPRRRPCPGALTTLMQTGFPFPSASAGSVPAQPVRVDVWHARLDVDAALVERCRNWLDAGEAERAARFLRTEHRDRFIVSHGLLRAVLATCAGGDPGAIRFACDPHGKPRLAGAAPDRGWCFNLSHSDVRAVVAVAWATAVGIDLERHQPVHERDRLVERFFAEPERRSWARLPVASRDAAFFRLWTRKEAVLKATGQGLGLGLERCAVSLDEPARLLEIPVEFGPAAAWTLVDLDLGPDFTAALAVRAAAVRIDCRPWCWDGPQRPGGPRP